MAGGPASSSEVLEDGGCYRRVERQVGDRSKGESGSRTAACEGMEHRPRGRLPNWGTVRDTSHVIHLVLSSRLEAAAADEA